MFFLLSFVQADVTFFQGESEYFVIEENQDVEFFCGDGMCLENETCLSCEVDCFECVENGSLIVKNNKNDSPFENSSNEVAFFKDKNESFSEYNSNNDWSFELALLFVFFILLFVFYLLVKKKK